ncbi:MAG TPA: CRTAC1 family protein [Acidobacteriota bacterium]|nr:CRTAC1 family protein [Acidobacteriota bacterium]
MRTASAVAALLLFVILTYSSEQQATFHDVTLESGIVWKHDNAMSPQRYLPETMNGGCAFLDYNNDGWLDIYLVNSGETDFYKPRVPIRNALYRNNKDGTFTDVTLKAGVEGHGFGMGVAAADYDGDGWTDILVTGLDHVILYRNKGDGTFEDVTEKAGLKAQGWSTSAAWLDYDNDGKLDLYICNFVEWSPSLNVTCGNYGKKGYCIPTLFKRTSSWLFHNNGDGTFTDVSKRSGIAQIGGKGLAVVAADFDNDGWIDIFQGNDTAENFLFKNNRNGTFTEVGLMAGVAYGREGEPRSSMGADAQDYDGDGWLDLCVPNIDQQLFSLYRNNRDGTFDDEGIENPEMSSATRTTSGWGSCFLDFDNNGEWDVVISNGHPDDLINTWQPQVFYRERPLLFAGFGGRMKNVSALAGEPFQVSYAGRGIALGDFDNDGDTDLLLMVNGGRPVLMRNDGGNRNNWLGVLLEGTKSNREGIGARLTYKLRGKDRIYYFAGGRGYCSSHDRRAIIGLGDQKRLQELKISWPSGTVDVLKNVAARQYINVREGTYPR